MFTQFDCMVGCQQETEAQSNKSVYVTVECGKMGIQEKNNAMTSVQNPFPVCREWQPPSPYPAIEPRTAPQRLVCTPEDQSRVGIRLPCRGSPILVPPSIGAIDGSACHTPICKLG